MSKKRKVTGRAPETDVKRALLAVALASVVVLSGCLGGGGNTGSVKSATDTVPQNVDFVFYVDGGIIRDDATKQLMNKVLGMRSKKEDYSGPKTYEALLQKADENLSVKLSAFNQAVMFGRYPNTSAMGGSGFGSDSGSDFGSGTGSGSEFSSGQDGFGSGASTESGGSFGQFGGGSGYGGVIIDAGWSTQNLVNSIEKDSNVSLTKTTYSGTTVYKSSGSGSAEGETWLGVVSETRYVIGTENATKDVIDVSKGDAPALTGKIKNEITSLRDGYVKFAATLPETSPLGVGSSSALSSLSKIRTVSGVYYTDDNSLGMNFSLNTESASAAKEIGKAANSIISLYSLSSSSGIGQALSNLKINRNAATVTMSYETSVDQLVSTLESLNETFGSFGSQDSFGSGSEYSSNYSSGAEGSGFGSDTEYGSGAETPDSSFGDSVQRKPAADVSATFDSNDDEVSVSFFSSSNAEYVEVTFSGDVTAEGRLNEVGDSLTLGPDGLSAGGSADVVSGSGASLQDGDTVTVKAVAHTSGGTSAVILEQTGEV